MREYVLRSRFTFSPFSVNLDCLLSGFSLALPRLWDIVGSTLWVMQGNFIASPPFPSRKKWHEQTLPRHVILPNAFLSVPNLCYESEGWNSPILFFFFFHCHKGIFGVSCCKRHNHCFPVKHLPIPILLIWLCLPRELMCEPPAALLALKPVYRCLFPLLQLSVC